MPALTVMKIVGNLRFFAKNHALPVDHTAPIGGEAADMYAHAFQPEDRVAVPTLLPPWFTPAERSNRLHQDACDKIGGGMKELHDTMLDAVRFAHLQWKLRASFRNLQINGGIAVGGPRCLAGPELASLIKSYPGCSSWTGNKAKHRDAVAHGVSVCFKSWQDKVTVPGLPWYPLFFAVPSPAAPPMPNVPTPLVACTSAGLADIVTPDRMTREMCAALDGELKRQDPDRHHESLYGAIATVLALAFLPWVASQMVVGVLGYGPVPTFAPPAAPVGPVAGGSVARMPGHLAA